jgi:hypothetical protein
MKNKFRLRSFISLYITLSFIIITLSGVILFSSPSGRVANWSNWRYLGLLKSQWQAIHTIFTFLFVIAALFHLIYNWKPLMIYIRTKINSQLRLRSEIFFVGTLVIIVFYLTTTGSIPFSSIMNLGQNLKDSWSAQSIEPPVPHAEELTIHKFAATINMDYGALENKLASKGIKITSDSASIKEISNQNGISPSQFYNYVKESFGKSISSTGEGREYGRKTVQQLCAEFHISVDEGLNKLKLNGISASKNDNIKEIASRNNMLPYQIAGILSRNVKE